MKTVTCPCGTPFHAHGSAKYCGDECKALARREQSRKYDSRRRPRPVHELTCAVCKAPFQHSSPTGRIPSHCPECRTNKRYRSEAWRRGKKRDNPPGSARRWHLKHKYGLTPDAYANLLTSQGGVCAGCLRPPGEDISFHVDHDHDCCAGPKTCGLCVRGLLCGQCNRALGQLHDDRGTLARLADYLERTATRKVTAA